MADWQHARVRFRKRGGGHALIRRDGPWPQVAKSILHLVDARAAREVVRGDLSLLKGSSLNGGFEKEGRGPMVLSHS